MIEKLKEYKKLKDEIDKDLANYFKDKSIPFAERSEAYFYAMNHDAYVHIKDYYWTSKVLEGLGIEDSFHRERYRTIQFMNLIEQTSECYLGDEAISQEDEDALVEEMMQSGYTGFVYDW